MTSKSVNGTELFEYDLEPCGQHRDHRWNRLRTICRSLLLYRTLGTSRTCSGERRIWPMPLFLSLASIPCPPCHRNSHSPGSRTGAGSHSSYPYSLFLSSIRTVPGLQRTLGRKQRWPPEVSTKSKHSNNAPCIPTVQLLSLASVPVPGTDGFEHRDLDLVGVDTRHRREQVGEVSWSLAVKMIFEKRLR